MAGTLGVLAVLHLCSNRPAKSVPRLIGAGVCVMLAPTIGSAGSLLLLGGLALVVAAQVGLELAGMTGGPNEL